MDIDDNLHCFIEMLSKSEARIDRTNEIVHKLTELLEKLNSEYSTHIKQLQDSRDKLIEQNQSLISTVNTIRDDYRFLDSKYDSLVMTLMSSTTQGKSENNIHVK